MFSFGFGKFIVFFIPGFIFTIAIVSVIDCCLNLGCLPFFIKANESNIGEVARIGILIILAIILGLVLDEIRHGIIDNWYYEKICELEKFKDYYYLPIFGADTYKFINENFFLYYEFEMNLSMSLAALCFCIWFVDWSSTMKWLIFIPSIVLSLLLFFRFAKRTMKAMISALEQARDGALDKMKMTVDEPKLPGKEE